MVHPDKKVREVLFSVYPLSYRIKKVPLRKPAMKKRHFLNFIDTMRSIEERRDFMIEEVGIDMTTYEDLFFRVIEDLIQFSFNKTQVQIIQNYIFKLSSGDEWDGKITVLIGKEERQIDVGTSKKLWSVIEKLID